MKINAFCLKVVLIGCFIFQIVSYYNAPYVRVGTSILYQQLGVGNFITAILKLIILVFVVVLYLCQHRYMRIVTSKIYCVFIFLLTVSTIIWLGITVANGHDLYTLLCESTPPYVYLIPLAVCVGADGHLWKVFIKYAKVIGFTSLLLAISDYFSFKGQFPAGLLGNSSAMVYYIQAFWLLLIVSLSENRKKKTLWLITILVCCLVAFVFTSRSWIIQNILWLLAYVFYTSSRKGLFRTLRIISLCTVFIGIGYLILLRFSPEILQRFFDKFNSDTRSYQYLQLFSQTKFVDYIIGRGYDFQYISYEMGGNYSYIDNAYLLMLIRYGIILCASYSLIFLYPLISILRCKSIDKRYAVILTMWLLALGGLSIYCVPIVDLKSIALAAVAGKAICEVKRLR